MYSDPRRVLPTVEMRMVTIVPSPIVEDLNPRVDDEKSRTGPMEELIEVSINVVDTL